MKERSVLTSIILTFLTCGIYGIIWFIQMTDDTVFVSERRVTGISGISAFLLTLVTCGIYTFIWNYQMGKAIQAAQQSKGLPSNDNSIIYVILPLVGLQIVTYGLIQADLNKIAQSGN